MARSRNLSDYLFDDEEARLVPGYDAYSVTSYGRIFSTKYAKVRELRQELCNSGAPRVTFSLGNVPKRFLVARLVALAFLGPRNRRLVIHLNGDSADNALANLKYGTRAELGRIAVSIPTVSFGEARPSAKLNPRKVRHIRELLTQGESHRSIAKRFAVSRPAIGAIARERTWQRA